MNLFHIDKFYDDEVVESIKEVLGTSFYGLKTFFYEKFFDFANNICSVLVTRRCFLMAIWFLGLLSREEDIIGKYNFTVCNSCVCITNLESNCKHYLITDKGLPLLRKLSDVNEVCVLDDICIHGRQLDKIKSRVMYYSGLKEDQVRKKVFMISQESMVIGVQDATIASTKGQWLIPSRGIVGAINGLMLPYVSCTDSYLMLNISEEENDHFLSELLEREDLIVKAFGADERNQLGKQSFYIAERSKVAESGKELACVRYYYNCETGMALFVPYVVLDSFADNMNEIQIERYLCAYLSSSAAKLIVTELKKVFEKNIDVEYVFNLLTCIASKHYGIAFAQKYLSGRFNFAQNGSDWNQDICDSIRLAFGEEIANIVMDNKNFVIGAKVSEGGSTSTLLKGCELVDVQPRIDDFIKGRWVQRENAALKRTDEPEKQGLLALISRIKQAGVEGQDAAVLLASNSIIAYSCLYSILDECDNGRMNIQCHNKKGECCLEVGELGVDTVRESTDTSNIDIEYLLNYEYYYYILS